MSINNLSEPAANKAAAEMYEDRTGQWPYEQGFMEAVRRAKANPWALFSSAELEELIGGDGRVYLNERLAKALEAEIERRKTA